ncbi:MAG: flavin monoamine oxidase family protein [Parvibaculaceae bacterium]
MAAATDVIIIGAGAAGLGAAKALIAQGKSVRLLEAQDRIGGRAYTVTEKFGVPFDWGCAWMHAADRNPFFDDAIAQNATLQHHDLNLDRLYFGARRATAIEMAKMFKADFQFAAQLEHKTAKGDRLAELLEVTAAGTAAGTYAGPMDFAQDMDEISAADLMAAADLDPNFLVREGFGAVVAQWAQGIPVELETPVKRLRWDGSGVIAETPRGELAAKAAIVTVSTGVLAFGGLRFAPDLPLSHDEAIHNLPMGLLTKIPLEIKGDRLGLKPFEDILIERHGHHDVYFLCFPFDCDLLVGFVGGDFAWELSAAGEAAAVDFAVQSLARTFGADIEKQIGRRAMTDWGANPYARGAYAAARPGYAAARKTLMEPVGNRIFFAGEALGGALVQTCAGARLSGEAVALKVGEGLK